MSLGKQAKWKFPTAFLYSAMALIPTLYSIQALAKTDNNDGPKIVIEKFKTYSKANAENMGRAIGISYGSSVIVSFLNNRCTEWFPEKKTKYANANKRWLEKNDKYAKQGKVVLDDLVKMTSGSQNPKAKRAYEKFSDLRNRLVSMMSRDVQKMNKEARQSTCDKFANQIEKGVLDVERRGSAVGKLLFGWNPDAFKEYMKAQGSL